MGSKENCRGGDGGGRSSSLKFYYAFYTRGALMCEGGAHYNLAPSRRTPVDVVIPPRSSEHGGQVELVQRHA
ncbi:unnamed protein product, partial [Iphiclides podalirius]